MTKLLVVKSGLFLIGLNKETTNMWNLLGGICEGICIGATFAYALKEADMLLIGVSMFAFVYVVGEAVEALGKVTSK